MSSDSTSKIQVSEVELTPKRVEGNKKEIRDTWWEYNVSEQFPIKSVKETNGMADIEVDKPHEGCTIRTTIIDSKTNGTSSIYSKSNVLMATLTFVNGIASGPCKIYEDGYLFFSGYFVNGYREGRGKEYDKNGNTVFDGFYGQGKKLNIVTSKEMGKGYWKELDENGTIIRISGKDDLGNCEGLCYLFKEGKITRVSVWNEGKEVSVMKQFSSGIMTEFNNGQKVYEGGYLESLELNYPRSGNGEEYGKDGKTRIFRGNYKYGKHHGKGAVFKNGLGEKEKKWIMGHTMSEFLCIQVLYIIYFVCLIISYIIDPIITIVLMAFLIVFLLICCKCHAKTDKRKWKVNDLDFVTTMVVENHLQDNSNSKSCKAKMRQCSRKLLNNIYLVLILILLFIMAILFVVTIIRSENVMPYISLFQTSLIIEPNRFNLISSFKLSNKPLLKTIIIKNNCFTNVAKFEIDGLKSLKSLIIGSNSFTGMKNGFGNDISKSFHILNCESLESIQIDKYSFSDFGGEFELNNLPQLQSIQIGTIGSNSYNFYSSSFIIQSILY